MKRGQIIAGNRTKVNQFTTYDRRMLSRRPITGVHIHPVGDSPLKCDLSEVSCACIAGLSYAVGPKLYVYIISTFFIKLS